MKKLFVNFVLLSIAIGIGITLFLMKQQVVEYEKQLATLSTKILQDKRQIHTLKADWAVLTEPSRLKKLLSESQVGFIHANQVVHADEVDLIPVPIPTQKPFEETQPLSNEEQAPSSNTEGENL